MVALTVKKLIENGFLSIDKPFRHHFTTSRGETGVYELTICSCGVRNFVYFDARLDGYELPCRSYRVNRSTLLSDLVNDLKDC